MRRRQALGLALVVALILVLAGGAWAVHRGRHHDLYDAFFLPVIAHRVAREAASSSDVVWRLHEFVNFNLRTSSEAAPLDDEPRAVLLGGTRSATTLSWSSSSFSRRRSFRAG